MLAKIKQFFAPPQFPGDDEKARVSNLLNTLLWMFFVVFLILTVTIYFFDNDPIVIAVNVSIAIFSLIPLGLLRRRHVRTASWVTLIVFYLGVTAAAFLIAGLNLGIVSSYMLLILLTGFLIGRTPANGLLVISITLGAILFHLENSGQFVPGGSILSDVVSTGAIFFLLTVILNLTLRDLVWASGRMRQSNVELQAIRANLENAVADRTRALELAAEVSRNISQTREMERLLQNAVDLIRNQFELYYVQVYLADKKQTRLSLKAGTGLVGKQLVKRDHGLPFGVGSINGLAAAEKRTVIVENTAVSPLFKANPLLPKTESEMAIPMLTGEKVIGVLNVQSDIVNGLSDKNLVAFETLAGQLAVAVENANLFAETAQARAEVERSLRFMARQGWDSYQDGLKQPETLGFIYEEDAIHPITDAASPAAVNGTELETPIIVANEWVGHIVLETDDTRPLTAEEKELVITIAQQVGQQAENLRLLAEADRYRQEAEQAVRRMRREAWQDYLADHLETRGFIYDQQQVTPIDTAEYEQPNPVNHELLRQSLIVQGEPFGEISLDAAANPETRLLVTAIAEQLSSHLENLRLSNQTEKVLAETAEQARRLAALNEISRNLSAVTDVAETFAVLSRHMASVIPHDFLSFALAKPNGTSAKILAIINGQPVTVFEDQPIAGTVVEVAIRQRQLMYLADVSQHDYADINVMAKRAGIRSVMIAPLITARGVLGGIDLMSNQVDGFNIQDQTLLQQVATLVASTLESQQLFAEAQKQAQKERLVNVITQKIQGTVTMESALETAVTELGSALGAKYTKIGLSLIKNENNNDGTA